MFLKRILSTFYACVRQDKKAEYRQAAARLKELARFTEELDFASLARRSETDSSQMRVKVEEGKSYGHGILNNGKIAVVHGYSIRGTTTQAFYHDELEYLIVYEGKAKVSCDHPCSVGGGKLKATDFILEDGAALFIPPGQSKILHAVEDTYFLSITIPASPLYPKSINHGDQGE